MKQLLPGTMPLAMNKVGYLLAAKLMHKTQMKIIKMNSLMRVINIYNNLTMLNNKPTMNIINLKC